MKKFLISLIIAGIVSTGLVFADIKYCGIGARLVKDPYNKKVFVKVVFPNSTAAKSGLPEGAEIISINDQKVKKLNIEQVTNLVRGEEGTKVKLQIKYYKEESTIEIPRAPFTFKEPEYDRFEAHWQQVVPVGIKNLEPIPHNMQVNMSKKWFNETVPIINYWIARKEKFRSGYNACMTYPESEQNVCLMNLTNREINKTAQDRQIELQENMIRQQAIQNSINNFNQSQMNTNLQNINNNLRNINNKLMY